MDIIFIRNLRVPAVIGIYAWEQAIHQTLHFNLELGADIRPAAASDHIEDTLNYKAVAKRITAFVAEQRFQLVETLAERVAELILEEFQVPWLRLELNKGAAVRDTEAVGILIERGHRD